ncbi:hypothetical protein [Clostridium sp. DL1XJH146]
MLVKNMKILDIITEHEETQEIFSSYDKIIGECVMCNHMFDSLEDFALQYSIDLQELIKKLNTSIS